MFAGPALSCEGWSAIGRPLRGNWRAPRTAVPGASGSVVTSGAGTAGTAVITGAGVSHHGHTVTARWPDDGRPPFRDRTVLGSMGRGMELIERSDESGTTRYAERA
uniref:hypothetical protein n=1 Tax=Actinacidiphila sp. bgisy145 TaxID=3413792 RepID=UPI003EBE0635